MSQDKPTEWITRIGTDIATGGLAEAYWVTKDIQSGMKAMSPQTPNFPDIPQPVTPTTPELTMPDPGDPVQKKRKQADILRSLQGGVGGTVLSQNSQRLGG